MLEFYSDALIDAILNHYEGRNKEQNKTMAEYISKDRAKHFLCEHCNEVCPDEPCEPEDCDWMHRIDKEPAADVAPVRYGTWGKVYKSGVTVEEGYVSSCCDMWNERKTHWCPNCGAIMDGGEQ